MGRVGGKEMENNRQDQIGNIKTCHIELSVNIWVGYSVCQPSLSPPPLPRFIHHPAKDLRSHPPWTLSPQLPCPWLLVGLGQTGAPAGDPGGQWLHPSTPTARSRGPLAMPRSLLDISITYFLLLCLYV